MSLQEYLGSLLCVLGDFSAKVTALFMLLSFEDITRRTLPPLEIFGVDSSELNVGENPVKAKAEMVQCNRSGIVLSEDSVTYT